MKKMYVKPEMMANEITIESLICLSLQSAAADDSAALVKERGTRTEVEAEDPEEILSIENEPNYGSIW
jgi:P pilus assembly chaperone PapD